MIKKALRRENVWLNEVSLRSLDARIINVKLIEQDATQNVTYGQRAGRDGRLILGRQRTSKPIRVEFAIRELYDLAARTAILDNVNAWAQRGGVLKSSTRPEQQAGVILTKFASAADIRDYTGTYTLEFEAAGVPYWEGRTAQTAQLTGSNPGGHILVQGTAETVLGAAIRPTGGALTAMTITVTGGGQSAAITLAGMSVSAGTAIMITHDERGTLAITADGQSLLSFRTAASDDDLFALPGLNAVNITADAAVSATITVRGRWT